MIKAVAYCRYSSELQRDGYSIEAQVRAIEEYCAREKILLVNKYIDEARSGTTDERESFQKMIHDSASKTFDMVIVHKLDRFARNRYDSAMYKKILKDNGVKLVSVLERLDDTPESIILESVLEGFNEYYSKNLSRETRKGLYARAREGKACGNVPLGLTTDESGHFIHEDKEIPIVKEIFARVASGEKLGSVASDLNNRGVVGKRGKKFSYHGLEKIIRNELYIGRYVYAWGGGQPVVTEDVVAPIISKTEFALANSKLEGHANTAIRRHRQEDYVLTGFLYCGECGNHYCGHLQAYTKKGKRYEYRRYRCTGSTKKLCDMPVIDKDLLEEAVFECIKRDMLNVEMMKGLTDEINAQLKKRIKSSSSAKAKKAIESLNVKKNRLLDLYVDGEIDKTTYLSRVSELDLGIAQASNELRLDSGIMPAKISPEYLVSAFKYFFEKVKLHSIKDQMMILNYFVERITIYRDKLVITYKIKNTLGEPVEGQERMSLTCTRGAFSTLLNTYYRISSYSLKANQRLVSSSDFIKYTITVL